MLSSTPLPHTHTTALHLSCLISFLPDLYFLTKWLEDCDEILYYTVLAHDITPPEEVDLLSLLPGEKCRASFANVLYSAEVVAVGMSVLLCVYTQHACARVMVFSLSLHVCHVSVAGLAR